MVEILLSTYNGEKFLAEQLDSILRQTYQDFRIKVRDDGSSDRTIEILEKYSAAHPGKISYVGGQNVGCPKSFFSLIQDSGDADYYAFSDQDDVWYDNKLERAIKTLGSVQEPTLYASAYELVNEGLIPLGETRIPPESSFRTALTESITLGCTMVMNKSARNLLLQDRMKEVGVAHDWWCYLVISAMGKVIYDPQPSLKYRQHGNNVSGSRPSFFKLWSIRLQRRKKNGGLTPWHRQAIGLCQIYQNRIPADKLKTLKLIERSQSSFLARVRLAFSPNIRRQRALDRIVFRILVLMGAYQ